MTGAIVKLGLVMKLKPTLEIVPNLLSEDVKLFTITKFAQTQAYHKNMQWLKGLLPNLDKGSGNNWKQILGHDIFFFIDLYLLDQSMKVRF